MVESQNLDFEVKVAQGNDVEHGILNRDDASSIGKGDILSNEHTDPVLNAKMHLINNVGPDSRRNKEACCSEQKSRLNRIAKLSGRPG